MLTVSLFGQQLPNNATELGSGASCPVGRGVGWRPSGLDMFSRF
jgi:hypothetical protein